MKREVKNMYSAFVKLQSHLPLPSTLAHPPEDQGPLLGRQAAEMDRDAAALALDPPTHQVDRLALRHDVRIRRAVRLPLTPTTLASSLESFLEVSGRLFCRVSSRELDCQSRAIGVNPSLESTYSRTLERQGDKWSVHSDGEKDPFGTEGLTLADVSIEPQQFVVLRLIDVHVVRPRLLHPIFFVYLRTLSLLRSRSLGSRYLRRIRRRASFLTPPRRVSSWRTAVRGQVRSVDAASVVDVERIRGGRILTKGRSASRRLNWCCLGKRLPGSRHRLDRLKGWLGGLELVAWRSFFDEDDLVVRL